MTKEFINKVRNNGIVDTKNYRYIYTTDNTGEYINRIPIKDLDTTAALTGWITVWIKR